MRGRERERERRGERERETEREGGERERGGGWGVLKLRFISVFMTFNIVTIGKTFITVLTLVFHHTDSQ